MISRTDAKIINKFPQGVISPPPSKSLSQRAVICAALAGGESVIRNVALSDDIEATLRGVVALGAECELSDGILRVRGCGKQREAVINCAESGATLRFLIPIAALSEAETVFRGKGRLLMRPMDAYISAFAGTETRFVHAKREIRVSGPLHGGRFSLPGDVSSQFVSGLMFALPLTEEDSEIALSTPLESRRYAEMTIDVMRRFGVEVSADETNFAMSGGQRYHPSNYTMEADYSQAAYFLGAAALGLDVKCAGLSESSRQGDKAILHILKKMGANIERKDGLVSVYADKLLPIMVDAREIPDLVPPVAALCCCCEGTSRIVNAGRLRLKESDRLHSLSEELGKLGANIKETSDTLEIVGTGALRGGRADAHHDHRIAMAVALAAIRCTEEVSLIGWHNVEKSYPNFWDDFEKAPLAPRR
jgi:3-phosphoshikimate 1-carboxyvinyltransferase